MRFIEENGFPIEVSHGGSVFNEKTVFRHARKLAAGGGFPAGDAHHQNAVIDPRDDLNNNEMDRKSLYVAEVYANPGPTLKRYVARSRGSASPILKRTSHISVVLDQK